MTADEIRPLIKRDTSFRPFRVALKDGRTFDIKDPWIVMAIGDDFLIGRPCPEESMWGIADGWEAIVTWDQVTNVEFLKPAVTA